MIDLSFITGQTMAHCYDSETGLYTPEAFLLCLEREVKHTSRSNNPFVVFIVSAPDTPAAAKVIAESIRELDVATSVGEGRFAVLLVGTDAEDSTIAADRIRKKLAESADGEFRFNIGIASFPVDGKTGGALLDRAAEALEMSFRETSGGVFYFREAVKRMDTDQPLVLSVDDDPRNRKLMRALLEPMGYHVREAADGKEALEMVGEIPPDLVLLDVMMPGMNGFEACKHLKSSEVTRGIPVVLLTALDDHEARMNGINAGADDFITKPPNREELQARCRSLVQFRMLNKNLTGIENVLFSLANAVEAKDSYTQGHIERVSNLAVSVGKRAGLGESELNALRFGGFLHDVGKIGVDLNILNKPGRLSEEEWIHVRRHPVTGHQICLPLKATLGPALDVVRWHHEKLDGSGYPDGIAGEDIPTVARIMAVVDIFDALATDRPYASAMSSDESLEVLFQEAGAGKLDRDVVETLAGIVAGHD